VAMGKGPAGLEGLARFCLRCGVALKWKPAAAGEPARRVCPSCHWIFYNNPRPCVGALMVRDGRVLLGRRAQEPFRGWWDIPGGFMEAGETPEEALAREVAEETGLQVKRVDLLLALPDTYGEGGAPTLNLHYLVEVGKGEPKPQSDVTELRWFSPGELPEQIAFENGLLALEAWRRYMAQSGHRTSPEPRHGTRDG